MLLPPTPVSWGQRARGHRTLPRARPGQGHNGSPLPLPAVVQEQLR